MSSDPLLQPLQLKHLRLRNRIITTAHEPAYAEDGMPKARYRAYHVERARAGVAMTMTAGSAAVSRDSPPAFSNLLLYRDEVVPWLAELADACHGHGAAVMIQLTHLGRRTRWDAGDWLPVVSPSHAREPAHRAFPKRLEDWDIARIVADFADAAERVKAAGLDGLELEAYGHLIDQFWSPRTNDLQGPYGGALEDRMRFSLEVLEAIRARVGPDFIVGVRCVADEAVEGGLTTDDGRAILRRLEASGLVDFFNIVRGHIDTDAALTDVIPIQGMASAPHLDFAGRLRAEIGLPVFHAARIPDVATARHAVASGKVDMVGMTRAHIADPHIVRKIADGREDEIRPCVGANYCLDRIYQSGAAFCIHNPSSGRELTLPHEIARAERPRKVVVVGAGPAGLEAARVCAGRGHEVVVLEAASRPGGQILLAAQSERRREMLGVVDWRVDQCRRSGVRFAFDAWADADTVAAERADVVLTATGGTPHTEVLDEGGDLVVSSWDVLSRQVRPGADVLLFDDAGDHAALQAAEVVAAAGARLEIVTPDRTFAPEIMGMNLTPYMRALQRQDVTFTVTYRLRSVGRDGNRLRASLGSDYCDVRKDRVVDQVIVNHGTVPAEDLYFALKPVSRNLGAVDYPALLSGASQPGPRNREGLFELYRIGDAVSARNIHAAVYDANRLARTL